MSGNVQEWCWDQYESYDSLPVIDPTGPDSDSGNLVRGGSYFWGVHHTRLAIRGILMPYQRSERTGFRLVSLVP